MPVSRYEIRNEYSLADPELYRAADKDDPEALLEGVAMAGLVGVLRQLGDLAEFAAEIFHDLHEEVMATAARGHGLMIRVQQLEAEVPSIEKSFLSQTDQSSSYYNPGVDWHPNVRMSQNLITQGDLPRFIMDSYEECRGPPRLFLLDKFDVAGAGSCLKRYTDPSFFKVETARATGADVQREKKTRKAKKKGPRWRNGETPEVLPTSHAKLHQLFLDEHVENGVKNPARRAKLKRKLNGFPFDSKTGKSYMEKLLRSPSPEHKVLDGVIVNSSSLILPLNDHDDSGLEILEVRPMTQDSVRIGRKRSPRSSPEREDRVVKPSIYEPNEIATDAKIWEAPNSYHNIVADGISSTFDKVTGEEDKAVDGESKREGSFTGYQSDDISSEIDNYVDAPSTIGSEMDTDSELRAKGDFTSSYKKNKPLASDDHLHTRSSDSQSTGESTISDEGNNSLKKEMSSFSSTDSPSTSAENPHSEKRYVEGFPSADIPEIDLVDASPYQKIVDEDFQEDQHSSPISSDDTFRDTPSNTNCGDLEQLTSSVDLLPSISFSDPEGVVKEGRLREPESVETACTSDDKEKGPEPVIHPACSPNASDSESQSGDDSLIYSDEAQAVDGSIAEIYILDDEEKMTEPVIHPRFSPIVSDSKSQSQDDSPKYSAEGHDNIPCTLNVSDNFCHAKDGSVAVSAELLQEDDSDQRDLYLVENVASTSNTYEVLSQKGNGTPERIATGNTTPGKLEDDIPKMPENALSDHPDTVHTGEDIFSTDSRGEKLTNELDNSNFSSDASNHSPCMMEASPGKELVETSLSNDKNLDNDDYCTSSSSDNQIGSANSELSHVEKFHYWPRTILDPNDTSFVPVETSVNVTPATGTPEFCEFIGLQDLGITDDDLEEASGTLDIVEKDGITEIPTRLEDLESPEDLEEAAGTSEIIEKNGITEIPTELEVTRILGSVDMKSVNEGHLLLEESDGVTPDESFVDLERPENLEETAGMSVTVESDGIASSPSGLEDSGNVGFADVKSPNEDDDVLVESFSQEDQADTADMASPAPTATDNSDRDSVDLPVDLDKLVEGHNNCFEDSDLHKLENDQKYLSESHTESDLLEGLGQREDGTSDLNAPFCNSLGTHNAISEESDVVPNSYQDPVVDHGLHVDDDTTIQSTLEEGGLDTEQESLQENDRGNDVSGTPCSPDDYNTEGTILQENTELPSIHPDEELPHAGEVSSELSILSPKNQQQMLNLDEYKGDINSGFSYVNSPSPPSVSELPGQGNHEFDVSRNPLDGVGSIVPGNNLLSETNQINLDELPPLPPLPPVQWRMGKFQLPSSTAEGDITKQKGLFPRTISPPTAFTFEAFTPPEETNHSLAQVAPSPASKEEKVELSSNFVVSTSHETMDFPQKIGNNLQQPTTSSNDVSHLLEEVNHSQTQIAPTIASKEEVEENCASSSKVDAMHETINLITTTENEPPQPTSSNDDVTSSLGENNLSLIQTTSKGSSSSLEAGAMHETHDVPPPQLVMPPSDRKISSPDMEDGVGNASGTVKLPRPRNPLIDAVAAIDKSKLRKVTERVRPQIQKVDERDSILEQIRTKSFNLKPTVASRPTFRGPRTNLKVAAILEKANAIRQALAGSDEDDEDNWSDS